MFMQINTPMVTDKFLNLKCLRIYLSGDEVSPPAYDYLSLVSFLDASPALETFILSVSCFSSCIFREEVFILQYMWLDLKDTNLIPCRYITRM